MCCISSVNEVYLTNLKECGYTYTAKDIEGLKRIVEKVVVVVVVFTSFTRFCDSIGLRRKESNINSIF